jgi:uncharacterized protein YegP (UPF0339 family)
MAAKFEIKDAKGGQFVFNLKAANGEVILTSETYKSKSGAANGIESVRKNSQLDSAFKREVAKNGQHFFVLKAGNGEPIGKSETYTTDSAMENGIASVKKNAPDAKMDDLTAK